MTTVAGNAQVERRGRGADRRDCFGIAKCRAGLLINGDPPDIHAPAAIAAKVEVLSVGRPERIQVGRRGLCNGYCFAASDGNGPNVLSLTGPTRTAPVRDTLSVRRADRLQRIALTY